MGYVGAVSQANREYYAAKESGEAAERVRGIGAKPTRAEIEEAAGRWEVDTQRVVDLRGASVEFEKPRREAISERYGRYYEAEIEGVEVRGTKEYVESKIAEAERKVTPTPVGAVLFSKKAYQRVRELEPKIKEFREREARLEALKKQAEYISPQELVVRAGLETGQIKTLKEFDIATTYIPKFKRQELKSQLIEPYKKIVSKEGISFERLELALVQPKEYQEALKRLRKEQLGVLRAKGEKETQLDVPYLLHLPITKKEHFLAALPVGTGFGLLQKAKYIGGILKSKYVGTILGGAYVGYKGAEIYRKVKAEPEFYKTPTGAVELALEPTLEVSGFITGGQIAKQIKFIKYISPTKIKTGGIIPPTQKKPVIFTERFLEVGLRKKREIGTLSYELFGKEGRLTYQITPKADLKQLTIKRLLGYDYPAKKTPFKLDIYRRLQPELYKVRPPIFKAFRWKTPFFDFTYRIHKPLKKQELLWGKIKTPSYLDIYGKYPIVTETGKLLGIKYKAYRTGIEDYRYLPKPITFHITKEKPIKPFDWLRERKEKPTKPIGYVERQVGRQILLQKLEPPQQKQLQKQKLKLVQRQKQLQKQRQQTRQQQRQKQRLALRLTTEQMQKQKPIVMALTKQMQNQVSKQILRQQQRQKQRVFPILMMMGLQKQIPVTTPRQYTTPRQDIITEIFRPTPLTPPVFTPFPLQLMPPKPKKKKKRERLFRYMPSLVAVAEKIYGKRPRILTGLEIRKML